ncbi:wall-associated receptor kinase-like 8, partial [Quercus suber]
MAVQVVIRITFLLLLTSYELAEAAAPIAKPNCSDSCGDIYIPYPFGKTTDCYLNDWFKIVCNETGGSLKAFLPSIGMEVLEINITDPYNNNYFWNDPGLIRVNMPIISSNCKNGSSRHIGGVNISGSPFFFSSYRDSFISVGCDNLAIMIGINPMVVVGCKSNCVDKSMIDDSGFEYCSGFNCCMTAIPSRKSKTGIQVFNASFQTGEECKFAFLADDKWLNSIEKDLSYYVQFLEYVPVVLEWTASEFITVDPNELRRRNSEGYPTLYGAQYYYCLKGYQGNSYLSTGCQDINECENKTLNKCPNKSDCVNIQGSYLCNKPKSPVRMAIIAICSSLGALFLFTIIWCLYRMIKKRNKIKLKKKFFKKNGGLLLQQQLSSNDNNVQNTKLFNSNELKNATDHFNRNRILGKGGQGALSYLHSAASIPIYHRDIKSSNILLDDKYRAKIADFGTSRSMAIDQTHVTTL